MTSYSATELPKTRPTAATVSIVLGVLAWLSPVIAFIGGIFIFGSGGGSFAGDGGPNLAGLLYVIFGSIATCILAVIGSLICLFGSGASPYPEQRRPWLLPKIINYPLGLLGLCAGLYWLAQRLHL